MLKAGEYYIGDPCNVISDDDWCDFLQACEFGAYSEFMFKGHKCAIYNTAYGDGTYFDQFDREYAVDAGLIGAIPMDLVANNTPGGQYVVFEDDFMTGTDDGVLYFGHVEIDTN